MSKQTAKSSKAATVLPSAGGAGLGLRGFGGFSGSQAVDPQAAAAFRVPTAAPAASAPAEAPDQLEKQLAAAPELDRELAQCLQHLGKRDATTRLKALQSLSGLVASKPSADVVGVLRPWCYVYAKLCMDTNRSVRCEAARLLGQLVSIASRAAAPHLRALLGPWLLAQHDPHSDTALAARNGFQSCFPSELKRQAALLLYCSDAVSYLTSNAVSTPDQLSDMRRDSSVEIEERHERVVSASLQALCTVVDVLAQQQASLGSGGLTSGGSQPADGSTSTQEGQAQQRQQQQAQQAQQGQSGLAMTAGLPSKPGFFKATMGSSSPDVRISTYRFMTSLASACLALSSASAPSANSTAPAPLSASFAAVQAALLQPACACAVLGAFGESEGLALGAVFDMVLLYLKAVPDCWQLPGAEDAFMRSLPALLRDGCRGAGPACWSALLPLLPLLPWHIPVPNAAALPPPQAQQEAGSEPKKAKAKEGGAKPGRSRSPHVMLLGLLGDAWLGVLKDCSRVEKGGREAVTRPSAASGAASASLASPAASFSECVAWALLQSPESQGRPLPDNLQSILTATLGDPQAEAAVLQQQAGAGAAAEEEAAASGSKGARSKAGPTSSPLGLALCSGAAAPHLQPLARAAPPSSSRAAGEEAVAGVAARVTAAADKAAERAAAVQGVPRAFTAQEALSHCLATQAVAAMQAAAVEASAVPDTMPASTPDNAFSACEQLLVRLGAAAPAARAVAAGAAAWLVPQISGLARTQRHQQQLPGAALSLPPAALRLLAAIVVQHPAAAEGAVPQAGADPLAELALCACRLTVNPSSGDAQQQQQQRLESAAQLVYACLHSCKTPDAAWAAVVRELEGAGEAGLALCWHLALCVAQGANQQAGTQAQPAVAALSAMAPGLARQVLEKAPGSLPSPPSQTAADPAAFLRTLPAARLLALLLGAHPARSLLISLPAAREVVQALGTAMPPSSTAARHDPAACSWPAAAAASALLALCVVPLDQPSMHSAGSTASTPVLAQLPGAVAGALPGLLAVMWSSAPQAPAVPQKKQAKPAPQQPVSWLSLLQSSSGFAVGGVEGQHAAALAGRVPRKLAAAHGVAEEAGSDSGSDVGESDDAGSSDALGGELGEEEEGEERDEGAEEEGSEEEGAASDGERTEQEGKGEEGSTAGAQTQASHADPWQAHAAALAACAWDGGRLLARLVDAAEGNSSISLQSDALQGVVSLVQGGLLQAASRAAAALAEGASSSSKDEGALSAVCALWASRTSQAARALAFAPRLQHLLLGACLGLYSVTEQQQQQQQQCAVHWCSLAPTAAATESVAAKASVPPPVLRQVMLKFSAHLAAMLPTHHLLGVSGSTGSSADTQAGPRAWLLVELLCAEQEQQQQCGAADPAVCSASSLLMQGLIRDLASPVSATTLQLAIGSLIAAARRQLASSDSSSQPFKQQWYLTAALALQRALAQLAAFVAANSSSESADSGVLTAAVALLERVCSEQLLPLVQPEGTAAPPQVPSHAEQQLLLHATPPTAAALRHHYHQQTLQHHLSPSTDGPPRCLPQLSTALLSLAASMPQQQQPLLLALAAFPVPLPTPAAAASGASGRSCMWYERACASATVEEVQGLCKLLHRHHLHSQATPSQLTPTQDTTSVHSAQQQQQQCSSSSSVQLCLAVAAYCHPQLHVSEWRTVLGACEGALADVDAAMQRQVAALAAAVRAATSHVVGGGSTEQEQAAEEQQQAGQEEQHSTGVVPLLLWRLLLGADTVPAQGSAGAHSLAWPAAGPHAQLLQRMGAALGVSVGPEGVLTRAHTTTDTQGTQANRAVWQPTAAHASAAQLLHLACCLAPHTQPLLACAADPSLLPSQPHASSTVSPPVPSTPLLLGRCLQLGVQLLEWAGALVGICGLCGGPPGQTLVSHWPGWSNNSTSSSSDSSSSGSSSKGGAAVGMQKSSGVLVASPLWPLLSDVAALAAHATASPAPPEAASEAAAAEEGADVGRPGGAACPEPSIQNPAAASFHASLASAACTATQLLSQQGLGVDATDALLALALSQANCPGVMAEGAYALLLAAPMLDLPLAPLATGYVHKEGGTAEEEEEEEESDQTQVHHPAAYLTRTVGMKPLLADAVVNQQHHQQAHKGAARHRQSAPAHPHVYLTAWALLLSHLTHRQRGQHAHTHGSACSEHASAEASGLPTCRLSMLVVRGVCTALREVPHLVPNFMDLLASLLPLQARPGKQQAKGKASQTSGNYSSPAGAAAASRASTTASASAAAAAAQRLAPALLGLGLPSGNTPARAAAPLLYSASLRLLPASARHWFSDLRSREKAGAIERYTAEHHSPGMVAIAIASMQGVGNSSFDNSTEEGSGVAGNFSVRANAATREVVAILEIEEGQTLELAVRLPPATPLKPPEVECRRNMGVAEAKLRKWLLSISSALRNANCSIADAIGQWQASVRAEFSGLEPCLICFSVVAMAGGGLPRLQCRTCNVRFHPACLYKWFKSSGKSNCPHCSTLW